MELSDWIGVIGGAAAIVASVAATIQAGQAKRAREDAQAAGRDAARLASEANRVWERIAEAQETVAQAHRPSAWGEPKGGSGDLWVIRNTSQRAIRLDSVDVLPAAAKPLFEIDGSLPRVFRSGEQFHFWARARLGLHIHSFTLVWTFADEDGPSHKSERLLL